MIIWSLKRPESPSLEAFLYSFRDRKTSDHILGDCDLAVFPIETGSLNLLVPRSEGTYKTLMEVWDLSVRPYYPYTDMIVSSTGFTGLTDPSDDPLRCRVVNGKLEAISVYQGSYQSFIDSIRDRSADSYEPLQAWFVSQLDGTKRFVFKEPSATSRHVSLSLDQDYHPTEYM